MTHDIKTQKQYFEAAIAGEKTFTIRFDDRDYQVGDVLHKIEVETVYLGPKSTDGMVDPFKFVTRPTGRTANFVVTYKMANKKELDCFGLLYGYCILGIKLKK